MRVVNIKRSSSPHTSLDPLLSHPRTSKVVSVEIEIRTALRGVVGLVGELRSEEQPPLLLSDSPASCPNIPSSALQEVLQRSPNVFSLQLQYCAQFRSEEFLQFTAPLHFLRSLNLSGPPPSSLSSLAPLLVSHPSRISPRQIAPISIPRPSSAWPTTCASPWPSSSSIAAASSPTWPSPSPLSGSRSSPSSPSPPSASPPLPLLRYLFSSLLFSSSMNSTWRSSPSCSAPN